MRPPGASRRRGALLLTVIAATVVACSGTPLTRVPDARGIAERYLIAVSTDTPDRGWSLLHSMAQEIYGPYERYVATAAAIDWSDFRWRQAGGEGSAVCDDGVICTIELDIEGGHERIPQFLVEPEWDEENGVAGVLQVSRPSRVRIVVLFDRGVGPAGVAAQRGG